MSIFVRWYSTTHWALPCHAAFSDIFHCGYGIVKVLTEREKSDKIITYVFN